MVGWNDDEFDPNPLPDSNLLPSLPPFPPTSGIYSSWQDYDCRNDHYKSPSLHLAQFQSQLEEALSLGPVHVNAHTGCDAWNEEKEVVPFFEKVLEAQRAMGSEVGCEGGSEKREEKEREQEKS
jgi:hypothetical protein